MEAIMHRDDSKAILPLVLLLLLFFSNPLRAKTNYKHLHSILDHDEDSQIRTYIVHVEKPHSRTNESKDPDTLESWHRSFLPNSTLDSGEPRLIYSYTDVISGFAAKLAFSELQAMKQMDGFLHASQDAKHRMETTYTPRFLGLSQMMDGTWSQSFMGESIVIGVIDSGIPPNHPSFSDEKMPPPPMTWRGVCNFTQGFTCNNKIIGAATFRGGKMIENPPVDTRGHGSHVASIAAGNFVSSAEVLGSAKDTASGMAPKAHLAIYKVCPGCNRSDILAAIDEAIRDRVDVINLSLNSLPTDTFFGDAIALGSFAAVGKGISVVTSAGNRGPRTKSLSHSAPWLTVVGASTTDRKMRAVVKLRNGMKFAGESGYQPEAFNSSVFLPFAYPGENKNTSTRFCHNGSLDAIDVKGKIVLCWSGKNNLAKGNVVFEAGGAAMILMNRPDAGFSTSPAAHVLPASRVSYADGKKIRQYFSSSTNSTPMATIVFSGTGYQHRPSPAVYYSSSRGPSRTNGGILKPDIIAPGASIVGAWPHQVGPYANAVLSTNNAFNFDSGTSMAAPHVAGVIALLKNKHPEWSPAAIQSAMITSANNADLDGIPIVDEHCNEAADIFATGAGQVNPSGAIDPGLIYDLDFNDYVGYLCGLKYSNRIIKIITQRSVNCSNVPEIVSSQLNYASIAASLSSGSPSRVVERTVTNVGDANSIYVARITEPDGVSMYLSTYVLQFRRLQQQESFTVTFRIRSSGPGNRTHSEGSLEWVSDKHVVRSPIIVSFS